MSRKSKVTLIPLGGLDEIGKNMMVVKYKDNIIIIDCGLSFPEEEMLGIDVVIPDINYLLEHRDEILGIVLTHGHEDHIGALPFVLKQLNVPVYGTRLTLGILQGKLEEHHLDKEVTLIHTKPREIFNLGPFNVEFIRVSHSIPDAVSIAIHTPLGTIIHTGDFKIDQTPVDGCVIDFARFTELGEKGVLLLLSDSTNVEKPGYTLSESVVGQTFDDIFHKTNERIILATFASQVHRLQQAITTAHRYARKVAVIGRSMVNVVGIAHKLGYLKIPEGILVELEEAMRLPKDKILFLCTGSQGEPMSALSKIARGDHRQLNIIHGDTVIISANAIPGNEKLVARVINQLFMRGANVIYDDFSGTHVSGHPGQEELKLMINMTRPRYFVPVHGESRMLIKHARLAEDMGILPGNIFVAKNGHVLEFSKHVGRQVGSVQAGNVLIDGLGVGDVGNIVLRDRKQLSQEGILTIVVTIDKESGQVKAGPDIISRGFVYVRESEQLLNEVQERVKSVLRKCTARRISEWSKIKSLVRDDLSGFLYEKTRRRPMILPIIMEVSQNR